MPLSFEEFTPSGGQTDFPFTFGFAQVADIRVLIKKADGTAFGLDTSQFSVVTSPSAKVVISDSAVFNNFTGNDSVRIFRDTDVSAKSRTFSNGSVLKSEDLNAGFDQILFAQQENDEFGTTEALTLDATSTFYDAKERQIKNGVKATAGSDFVTLDQVNAVIVSTGNNPSVPQSYSTGANDGSLTFVSFDSNTNINTFALSPSPTSEFEQTFIVEIDGVIQNPTEYTITAGTGGSGSIAISHTASLQGADIVITNFGLSREVFDFPVIGAAATGSQTPLILRGLGSSSAVPIFKVQRDSSLDVLTVTKSRVNVFGRESTAPALVVQGHQNAPDIANFATGGTTLVEIKNPDKSDSPQSVMLIRDQSTGNKGADSLLTLSRESDQNVNNEFFNLFVINAKPVGSALASVFICDHNGRIRIRSNTDVTPQGQTGAGAIDQTALLDVGVAGTSTAEDHNGDAANSIYFAFRGKSSTKAHLYQSKYSNTNPQGMTIFQIGHQNYTGTGGGATFALGTTSAASNSPSQIFDVRVNRRPQDDGVTGSMSHFYYMQMVTYGNPASSFGRRGELRLATSSNNGSDTAAISVLRPNGTVFQVVHDGGCRLLNTSRFRGDNTVLRQDEIRNESPQYTSIAVAHANATSVAPTTVVFNALNTSGYVGSNVILADANRQVRITTAGTYLVEISCTASTASSISNGQSRVAITLQQANGSGGFTNVVTVRGQSTAVNGSGNYTTDSATLVYRRILTLTQLKKYRINISNDADGFGGGHNELHDASILVQRLSN